MNNPQGEMLCGAQMPVHDPRRRAVSERLRQFFSHVYEQASGGVEELWNRVEAKLHVTDNRDESGRR